MTKDTYIQEICKVVSSKSSCFKRKVGAVFVNYDYEILATGYNEAPSGFPHCDMQMVFGPPPNKTGTCGSPCIRTIHAEQNAIAQAAKRGTALRGSMLYCTYTPCIDCARLLINIGVTLVMIQTENKDGGKALLEQAGIQVKKWDGSDETKKLNRSLLGDAGSTGW